MNCWSRSTMRRRIGSMVSLDSWRIRATSLSSMSYGIGPPKVSRSSSIASTTDRPTALRRAAGIQRRSWYAKRSGFEARRDLMAARPTPRGASLSASSPSFMTDSISEICSRIKRSTYERATCSSGLMSVGLAKQDLGSGDRPTERGLYLHLEDRGWRTGVWELRWARHDQGPRGLQEEC